MNNARTIAREEVFGPVISLIAFDTQDDSVGIANDSDYGLSGSVYAGDVDRGIDIARKVRTGTHTVNGFGMDFGSPFGGFKGSGLGRELGSEGLEAHLESKTINLPGDYVPPAG